MPGFKELVIDATKALRDDDYDTAIDIYKKEQQKNNKETYAVSIKGIAQCYEWKGDLENAIEYANKMLSLDPNDSEMLMLAARYWFNNQNEEMTYKYVCKVIANPPEPIEQIPKWTFWIIKPFSLFFKNLRKIEKKSESIFSDHEQKNKERVKWAMEYKNWYESKDNLI